MGDRQDHGGDRRSGTGPDPTAHVRGLVDAEHRGLLAANELVDRLIRSVDGDDHATPPATDPGAVPRETAPAGGGQTDQLMRLWANVVRLGLDTFGHLLTSGASGADGGARGATLDVAAGASTGVVRIGVVPPAPSSGGGTPGAGAEVWLHNGSEAAYADVGLHCGDLRASHGGALPAASVRFDPSVVDLPARSSRGVVVSVDADVPPGTYRGVVLAAGVPDAWLPIEVVVAAEGREG